VKLICTSRSNMKTLFYVSWGTHKRYLIEHYCDFGFPLSTRLLCLCANSSRYFIRYSKKRRKLAQWTTFLKLLLSSLNRISTNIPYFKIYSGFPPDQYLVKKDGHIYVFFFHLVIIKSNPFQPVLNIISVYSIVMQQSKPVNIHIT
jgi:hypothetical protein